MDLETLNYVRKVNQTDKNKSLRRNEIDDMVDDYELARQEIITRFSVMVKTSDAKQVYVNFSDNYIMGVLDKTKNYSATTVEQDSIQTYPNLINSGDYLKFKVNRNDDFNYYLVTSDIRKLRGYDEGIIVKCDKTLYWNNGEKAIICPAYSSNVSSYQSNVNDNITNLYRLTDFRIQLQISNNIEDNKYVPNWVRFKELYPDFRFLLTERQDNQKEGLIFITLVKDIFLDDIIIIKDLETEDDFGRVVDCYKLVEDNLKGCVRSLKEEDLQKQWGYDLGINRVLYITEEEQNNIITEDCLIEYEGIIYKTVKFIRCENPDTRLLNYWMVGLVENEDQYSHIINKESEGNSIE